MISVEFAPKIIFLRFMYRSPPYLRSDYPKIAHSYHQYSYSLASPISVIPHQPIPASKYIGSGDNIQKTCQMLRPLCFNGGSKAAEVLAVRCSAFFSGLLRGSEVNILKYINAG